MPRIAWLAIALSLPALSVQAASPPREPARPPSHAPSAPAQAPAEPAAEQNGPPHAWLFGTWTGGLYPAPAQLTAAACLAHPTVIFTQDVLLRAQLTDLDFAQRNVETVRVAGAMTEFRFTVAATQEAGMFGATGQPAPGFGCESPDVLHVQRLGLNEISFPGCADFPNPLVRCPAR